MGKYKKCPRCELNYILQDEDMCDVCKSELGLDSKIVLLDDIIDDDEPLKLCPVCKTSYIGMDEEMCENCLANYKRSEDSDMDDDNDDWRTYLDDEDTKDAGEEDIIPLEELENDEDFGDEEEFEDEENVETELEDYPDDLNDDYDVDYEDDDSDDVDDEDEEDD